MNLKNAIVNYYHPVELTSFSRDIIYMVIENEAELLGDLKISGFENLQSIDIYQLSDIRSLTISNNPLLQSIMFDEDACYYVANFELASLFYAFSL